MKVLALTNGGVTIVDDDVYKWASMFNWHKSHDGYAIRHKPRPSQSVYFLHRIVNKTPNHLETDHINCDRLDNRRKNLRSVTHAENNWNTKKYKNNTSGFKGLVFHGPTKSWGVKIQINRKRYSLGYFKSKKDAALAYRVAERLCRQGFFNFKLNQEATV